MQQNILKAIIVTTHSTKEFKKSLVSEEKHQWENRQTQKNSNNLHTSNSTKTTYFDCLQNMS